MNFMIIGIRFFGKVDHVPDLFFVATRFLHVFFFLLIPLGSYLVYECQEEDIRHTLVSPLLISIGTAIPAVRICFNFKSTLLAYLRVCIVSGIPMAFFGVIKNQTFPYSQGRSLGILILLLLILHLTYFLTRAKNKKAIALGQFAGIPADVVVSKTVGKYPPFGFFKTSGKGWRIRGIGKD